MKTRVRPLEGRHRTEVPTWYYVLALVPILLITALYQLPDSVWLGILVCLVLLGVLDGMLFVLVRVWGPQTQVHPRGLCIREGPRRQKELAWDDVVAVETRSWWDGGQRTRLQLENGAAVELPGLQSGRWARELEAYWQAHRSGPDGGSPTKAP